MGVLTDERETVPPDTTVAVSETDVRAGDDTTRTVTVVTGAGEGIRAADSNEAIDQTDVGLVGGTVRTETGGGSQLHGEESHRLHPPH